MTTSLTTVRSTASGNGSTTTFPITFSFGADSHLKVYKETSAGSGSFALQTISTHYTISGAISGGPYGENDADVIFTSAPANGVGIIFVRQTPNTQGTDLPVVGVYSPQSIENQLDTITRINQEQDEIASRSLRLSVNLAGTLPNTEITSTLAGGILRMKTDGSGFELANSVDAGLAASVTPVDNGFLVGNGTNFVTETGATARTSMGLGALSVLDTVSTSVIDNDAVTYAKLQNVSATDRLLGRSTAGAGDVEEITCTSFARTLLDDANAAAARTTLGTAIGSDVQAYDAGLASIAGLTTLADRTIYTTASDTYAVTTLTSFGRSLIDDADASAGRTTLGLGTLATQSTVTASSQISGQVPLANGGTAASLTDPNADRIMFWDDSAGAVTWLTPGANLVITGTTIDASGGAGVSDGDKGDITVSGGGATWTIDNSAVTFAKMQNITTARLLGQTTGGAAPPAEISVSSPLTLSGSALGLQAASTTQTGSVEMADATEAQTFSNTTRVLTPSNLADVRADEATTEALTSNVRFVSPLNLGQSLVYNGNKKLIEAQTFASTSTVDFETGINSTYNRFILEFRDIVAGNDDVRLELRTAVPAGAYDTGASDYDWATFGQYASSATFQNAVDAADDSIVMMQSGSALGVGNAAGEGIGYGEVHFCNPAGTSLRKMFLGQFTLINTAAGTGVVQFAGSRISTSAVGKVRIFASAGVISGTIKLYGVE